MLDSPRACAGLRINHHYFRNTLLRTLPDEDRQRLLPHLERIELRRRGGAQFPSNTLNHVYFIEDGLVSVLADTGKGKSIETRMIGPEGFIGIRVALGKREGFHRRVVQVAGSAMRVDADVFAALLDDSKALHQVMLDYVHTVILQGSQLSACNANHAIPQRLARWILMAHDRCGTDELTVTQKMLSRVLGVRRATISECLAAMEPDGILERSRSIIRIADRDRLEALACRCYAMIGGSLKLARCGTR